jgi:hypothetical protein
MTPPQISRLRAAAALVVGGFLAFAPAPTHAAIAQRGSAATALVNQNGTSISLNKPSGVVAGDVMLAVIAKNVQTIGTTSAPSGWTQVAASGINTSSANNKTHGSVFYRVADGSEGGSFSFGLGGGTANNASNGASGALLAFSGVNTTGGVAPGGGAGPFDVATGTITVGGAASNSVTANGITTQSANAAVVMLGMVGGNAFTWSGWNTTSPGGLTEIAEAPRAGSCAAAAWAIKSSAGATGNGTATLSSAAQIPAALLVALKELPSGPTISSFTAAPTSVFPGQSSTLSWNVSNATSVSIDNGIGDVSASGSTSVTPAATATYTLTATNNDGTTTATATVTVAPPAISSFTATPTGIDPGQSSTLAWNVSGADTVMIDNGVGAVSASGSTGVSPAATTTYTLTASNAAGSTTATATVTIFQPGPYRYYRFVPVTLRTPSENMVQISEFQMLMDGVRVAGATASNPGGNTPGSEGPAQANDNNVDTKWLDFNIKPLVLDFGTTTDVNGYRWATANDSDGRDPVSWRVEGSHDNTNWKILDTKTAQTVPTARKTYLADFSLDSFTGPTISSFTASPQTLFLGEATSSTLSWAVTNADPGGVSLDNGIGTVAASDSTSVSPVTTTTYTLTATGDGVTRTRTVTVRRVPVGSLRYFRFVPVATRNGGIPVGLSEFQILFDGARVAGAVANNPGGASPGGSEAPQANDNNLDTEWADYLIKPLVLDFGDLVGFNGYRWATGTGASSQDPVSWKIEGSTDGTTWQVLDERTNFAVPTARKTYLSDMPLPASAAPEIASFAAAPVAVNPGGSSTLSWTVTGADTVSIDNGIGPVAASGSTPVTPAANTTYTLTATNGDGTTTATATVIVISGTPATYTFDDLTFQGWTDLTPSNTNNGPRYFTATHTAPGGLFLRDGTQSGAGAIEQVVQSSEDNAHPTLRLRSPEFKLNGSGDLSAWLKGGPGSGSLAGTNVADLPANSSEPGFQGLALRNATTGTYVLSVRKTTEGDWQQVSLSAAHLAALDQSATYTLDLIDAGHGGWGWVTLDTVSIPGNFNHPPTFAGLTVGTPYDTAANISLGKVLAEAVDPDGDPLTVTAAGPASAQGGTAVLQAGSILYTPANGFSGSDSFPITIADNRGGSVSGTVTVTVQSNVGVGLNEPVITLLPGNQVGVAFQGIPGRSYEIQRSPDLTNWTVLETITAAANGAVNFIDPSPPGGSAFYRIRKP